ncbi:hypothetical protein CMO89_00680 [Candidatus Woesearchaeota archaeon]|nr:hypothetical protein [Candidatus Woesearchaeota archaeon]|tara:strand:- start:1136 stop:2293 length:1158 start_codon:yes stop_codon:yes gene_type:complete
MKINWAIFILIISVLINIVLLIKFFLYKYITYPKALKSLKNEISFKVHVFVPCKGWNKELGASLESIANQRFHNYKLIFITESINDPAVKEIEKIRKKYNHAAHVIAGKSSRNCQKNFNLLKGIEEYPNADVYVFCDSDIIIEENWLFRLVRPLQSRKITVTTSFDSSTHRRENLSLVFKKFIDAYLYFLLIATGAVWGGSFAIRKDDFFRLKVNNSWEKFCVDDVSLTKILLKKRKRGFCVPISIRHIRENTSLSDWVTWLIRQIMFLKYYLKGYWILALINFTIILIPIFMLPINLIISFLTNRWTIHLTISVIMFMFLYLYFGIIFLIKKERITKETLVYLYPVLFINLYSLYTTLFNNTIKWAGKEYTLNSKGTIKTIKFK